MDGSGEWGAKNPRSLARVGAHFLLSDEITLTEFMQPPAQGLGTGLRNRL